jgi:hypothetical protein
MAISLANTLFLFRKERRPNRLRHSESEMFLTTSYVTDLSKSEVNTDGYKATCFDKGRWFLWIITEERRQLRKRVPGATVHPQWTFLCSILELLEWTWRAGWAECTWNCRMVTIYLFIHSFIQSIIQGLCNDVSSSDYMSTATKCNIKASNEFDQGKMNGRDETGGSSDIYVGMMTDTKEPIRTASRSRFQLDASLVKKKSEVLLV